MNDNPGENTWQGQTDRKKQGIGGFNKDFIERSTHCMTK